MKRRNFLKGLGASALCSAALSNKIFAEEAAGIKRFIVCFTYHGVVYDGWKMHPENAGSGSWEYMLDDGIPFSNALAPLAPFQDRLMVLDGLAMVSAEADANSGGTRHENGTVHALTGGYGEMVENFPMASGASLDQLISRKIADPGQFPSLEWGVGAPFNSPIYRERRMQLPYESSPLAAYQRLFGASSASAQSVDAQRYVLDAVQKRYEKLAVRQGNRGRVRLEQHNGLLQTLGMRLQGLQGRWGTCETPAAPSSIGEYQEDFRTFAELAATAFSCDLTRVISFNLGQVPNVLLTGESGDVHEEWAHDIFVREEAAQMMSNHNRINAQQMADLMAILDNITDPLGAGSQTLLDNTMILWVSELGDSTHSFDKWPVVIGGGNGFSQFRMGRYLHYPADTPYRGWHWDGQLPTMGRPHQHLINSIARQFGIDDSIGIQSFRGKNDALINCAQTLTEMI